MGSGSTACVYFRGSWRRDRIGTPCVFAIDNSDK